MTRRDQCELLGVKAGKLSKAESEVAWRILAEALVNLGDCDLPKWKHLMNAIRGATESAILNKNDL